MTSFKRWFGAGAIVVAALVLVACPGMAPSVTKEIPNMQLAAGATEAETIQLDSYFKVDRDATYGATSDNTDVVTVDVAGALLTVTPKGTAGTANVQVTASKGGTDPVSQSFSVTVAEPSTPTVNNPPAIRTVIQPMTIQLGSSKTLELSDYYLDVENDTLTYAATVSNNPSVATISRANSMITITGAVVGTATITVTAADGPGRAVPQMFDVTVAVEQDNNQPRQIDDIRPPTGLMYGGEADVDLSPYFIDDDGDDITYSVDSSNTNVVTVSVSGSIVRVEVVSHGTARIIVTAKDPSNEPVTAWFDVTVDNQPPMATDANRQLSLSLVSPDNMSEQDLSRHFTDLEGDALTYSVDSVEPEGVLMTPAVSGSTLVLTALGAGTADVEVRAEETGLKSNATTKTFRVVVTAVPNERPRIVGDGIPDQPPLKLLVMNMMESVTSEPIDLSMYFMDPDEMPSPLTYTDSSNISGMKTTIEGSMLTITADAAGTTMITVTATDGVESVSDKFSVMVTAPDAPTRTGPPPGVQTFASSNAEAMDIELDGYFHGATGYEAESDDETVVTASVSNSTVTLTPEGAGTALVTVTAQNSGDEVATLIFRVKVSDPVVAAPTVKSPIRDQTVVIGDAPLMIDVSVNFSDATDYDALCLDDAKCTAEVTAAGMLTLTAGTQYGTTNVWVRAFNDAGSVPDEFEAEVQAKPTLKKIFEDWYIHVNPGEFNTKPIMAVKAKDYVTDPDGEDEKLQFMVTSSDKAILEAQEAEDGAWSIKFLAFGIATVTVTATDEDMNVASWTYEVTVVGGNERPTALPRSGLIKNVSGNPKDTKLYIGEIATVIDEILVGRLFDDSDFVRGDELTFELGVYKGGTDIGKIIDTDGRKIAMEPLAPDKAQVSGVVSINGDSSTPKWGGDASKITVTLTALRGGTTTDRVWIIATDRRGRSAAQYVDVHVNSVLKSEGAQADLQKRAKLSGQGDQKAVVSGGSARNDAGVVLMTWDGVLADNPFGDNPGSNVRTIKLLATNGGHFHDPDGDIVECSYVRYPEEGAELGPPEERYPVAKVSMHSEGHTLTIEPTETPPIGMTRLMLTVTVTCQERLKADGKVVAHETDTLTIGVTGRTFSVQ